jgi:MarR family transcriptional regulator, negative regulator of the multidrug operon emrRAB
MMNRIPDEAINPSSLAQKLGVTRATMTGLLDGLHKKGLIERRAQASDRRKVGVLLTAGGRRTLDNILPDYYRLFRRRNPTNRLSEFSCNH